MFLMRKVLDLQTLNLNMGIEAVKSSTPQVCRVKIKEAIKTIMSKEQTDLHNLVADFRKEFFENEGRTDCFS